MNNAENCSYAPMSCMRKGISLPGKIVLTLAVTLGSFVFTACEPQSEDMKIKEAKAEAQLILNGESSITTDTINGVAHNFIKNASLKCKVKDVLTATSSIEELVSEQGGYVSGSHLASVITRHQAVQVKKDSLREDTYYQTSNIITLRLPVRKLDTLMKKISELAVFVDYRKLSTDDVKLKLAANKLEEARLRQFSGIVIKQSASNKTKGDNIVSTASAGLAKQIEADEKSIASYELADRVNYSTVTLELYQEQRIHTQILANPLDPEPYVTPFVNKLGEAFVNGFELLKQCILFLVNAWGLILILTVLFVFIKRRLRYQKNPV